MPYRRFRHRAMHFHRFWLELIWVLPLFIVVFGLCVFFELSEELHEFTAQVEWFEFDELALTALIVWPIYMLAFSLRRFREIRALVHDANTDVLTGTVNRRGAMELLDNEVRRAQRYQRSLAIILLDIDHFKHINDQYGHPMGDEVLKAFSAILLRNVRTLDVVSRTGGEEFMVLATETDSTGAIDLAERLRIKIEGYQFPKGIRVTSSLGVAQVRPGESSADLFQRADERLYWAKRNGRNRVVYNSGEWSSAE